MTTTRLLTTLEECDLLGLVPVGSYGRISDDRAGRALGRVGVKADTQHDDGHRVARQRSWGVVIEYTDNDLSAYQDDVIRHDFEKMLKDLEEGRIRGIVTYNLDRFLRRNDDLERVIKVYKKLAKRKMTAVFASAQGDIDLSTPEGQQVARHLTTANNAQSAATARRVERGHRIAAELGRPAQVRGFGYSADRTSLDLFEADLIQRGAKMLINDEPLAQVARMWNAEGALTVFGKQWVSQTVRQLYKTPRIAGLRVHQGEILRDEDGNEVYGQWEPVLSRETWDAVLAVFEKNAKGAMAGGGEVKYLLSGIAQCEHCGTFLHGAKNDRTTKNTAVRIWARENGYTIGHRGRIHTHIVEDFDREHPNGYQNAISFVYMCPNPTQRRGACGKTSIAGLRVDALISQLMEARLTSRMVPDVPFVFTGQQQLDDAHGQVEELMTAYRAKILPSSVAFPQVAQIQKEIARLESEQRSATRADVQARQARETTPETWRRGTLHQRRVMLQTELSAILVKPSAAKGGVFEASRVVPDWRESVG